MKNQFVGDIGDYGKYSLLKAFGDAGAKVGVNWYLTEDDGSSDGKKTLGGKIMDCPRCGTPMSGGVCPECGFPVTGIKVMYSPDIQVMRALCEGVE